MGRSGSALVGRPFRLGGVDRGRPASQEVQRLLGARPWLGGVAEEDAERCARFAASGRCLQTITGPALKKAGRNSVCPCGSKLKVKSCHGMLQRAWPRFVSVSFDGTEWRPSRSAAAIGATRHPAVVLQA